MEALRAKRVWAVTAGILVAVGMLFPVVRVPHKWHAWKWIGDYGGATEKSLFGYDPAAGVLCGIIVVVLFARLVRLRFERLILAPVALAGVVGFSWVHFLFKRHEALEDSAPIMGEATGLHIAVRATSTEWGWGVLVLGIALLFAAIKLPGEAQQS